LELDANRDRRKGSSQVTSNGKDHATGRDIDGGVVDTRPFLAVSETDDIDPFDVAKICRQIRDAQIVIRADQTVVGLARIVMVV
jgi:hypothetical protein